MHWLKLSIDAGGRPLYMRDCFPSWCLLRYLLSTKCILFLRRLCLPQMAPMLLRFICTMVTYSTDTVGIQLHCKNKIFAKKWTHLRWQVFIKISMNQFCPVKGLPSSVGSLLWASVAWPLQTCFPSSLVRVICRTSTDMLNSGKREESFLEMQEELEIPTWSRFTDSTGDCIWTCP